MTNTELKWGIWFVTFAGVNSTLDDICFHCAHPTDMQHQFLGGLNGHDVIAMYSDGDEAKARARQVLADRDALVAHLKANLVCQ